MYAKEKKSFGHIRQHHPEPKQKLFSNLEFLDNFSLNEKSLAFDDNEETFDDYDEVTNDEYVEYLKNFTIKKLNLI